MTPHQASRLAGRLRGMAGTLNYSVRPRLAEAGFYISAPAITSSHDSLWIAIRALERFVETEQNAQKEKDE